MLFIFSIHSETIVKPARIFMDQNECLLKKLYLLYLIHLFKGWVFISKHLTLVMLNTNFKHYVLSLWRGVTLAQLVKVVVMWLKGHGFKSWKHSLLCKKQGKAAYNTPKMVGPLPGPCVCASFSAPGCHVLRLWHNNFTTWNCSFLLKFSSIFVVSCKNV